MRLSALATGMIAMCFLPFTGWGLPVAALLVLATHKFARVARAKVPVHSPAITGLSARRQSRSAA